MSKRIPLKNVPGHATVDENCPKEVIEALNKLAEIAYKQEKQSRKMTKDRAYKLGYDAGYNGSNMTNCHFSIFSTPEFTAEWERGKKEGEEARSFKNS